MFVRDDSDAGVERAKQLVWKHGFNTTVFQLLNPGIERWFDAELDCLIGCVTTRTTRVVAGAPVCPVDRLQEVLDVWEGQARSDSKSVCYFGGEERLLEAAEVRKGYSKVFLGAQPVWSLQHWKSRTHTLKSFRAQLNRARNKGVIVEEWPYKKAQNNPDLQRVLNEWLKFRGMPPLHFMVEPFTLANLSDRRIFVASWNQSPVAFLVCSPIPQRNGYLTEQFPRLPTAPNGTAELMMDFAAVLLGSEGADYFTMGIVPLSSNDEGAKSKNPGWLRFMLGWVRAHGRRFYNFDGLDLYKRKFNPELWDPIYALSNENRFSFTCLWAIAVAFCQASPILSVAKALAKAVTQEAKWLTKHSNAK